MFSKRSSVKSDRRRDLMRILHDGGASSQQEIVAALRAAGHDVTQATVSRDLRHLGAMKVRAGERFVYRLVDDIPRAGRGDLVLPALRETLEEFAVDISQASSLVVILTAPGHAAAVARAIDLAGVDEVAGTVAGDDTIFVATADPSEAKALAKKWRNSSSVEV
jgi:transcriptional regulator of arginine metabolism